MAYSDAKEVLTFSASSCNVGVPLEQEVLDCLVAFETVHGVELPGDRFLQVTAV